MNCEVTALEVIKNTFVNTTYDSAFKNSLLQTIPGE
jgi:hypothetical protein